MKSTKFISTILAALAFSSVAALADSAIPAGYPLKNCPVSGEAYGGGMTPIKVTHAGTDVWLCCKSCLKKFDKDPAKYAKTVQDAATKK